MADRLGKTLRGYLAREMTVGFVGGLALFTFILLIARIMKLVENAFESVLFYDVVAIEGPNGFFEVP